MPNRFTRRNQLVEEIVALRELAFPVASRAASRLDLATLEVERDAIVRARVLVDCSMVEEMAAEILMHHWLSTDLRFGRRRFFGRTPKYRSMFDALGHLTARNKMAALKGTLRPPRHVTKMVERMFALRDVFAHVFTLTDRDLSYKGVSILTAEGFARYSADYWEAVRWFRTTFRRMDRAALRRAAKARELKVR